MSISTFFFLVIISLFLGPMKEKTSFVSTCNMKRNDLFHSSPSSSSSSSSMSLTLFYAASSCASLTIDIDESILNCARVSSIVGQMAAHSNQSGSNRNFVSLLRRIRIRRRRLLLLLLLLRFCFIFYLVNVDFNHRRQKIAQ